MADTVGLLGSRGATYGDLIVEAFQRFADNEAFVLGEQRMTFAEAADSMSRIQQLLVDRGITHGSSVGALSVNIPEVWLTRAATYLTGAAHYTGLHPMGSVEDHVWICDDVEIELLVVHPTFAEVGVAVAERSKTVKHLLVFGESDAGQDLFELIEGYNPKPLKSGPAGEEDIAWLQYTGRPKGVMLSHRAMVEQCKGVLTSWQIPAKPRYLVAPSITHAGVLPLLPTLARGGTVILLQGFGPKSFVQAIEKERANCTFAVPTMINALLDHTTPEEADLSPLETFTYEAAPISPSRLAQALNRFGQKFVQCFGQTECIGLTTSRLREEHDPVSRPELLTSCGRPAIGTMVRIVDGADQPVPDGTPGELCVRSRVVMSGYWKLPEDTLRNGWLHTLRRHLDRRAHSREPKRWATVPRPPTGRIRRPGHLRHHRPTARAQPSQPGTWCQGRPCPDAGWRRHRAGRGSLQRPHPDGLVSMNDAISKRIGL